MRIRVVAIALVAGLALAACSSDDGRAGVRSGDATSTTAEPFAAAPAGQRYEAADATVLESPDHGPQLCLGAVAASLPPQCGGPDIVGWDWEAVDGDESLSGVTWGSYRVVGTYEVGGPFTLTEPPSDPRPVDPSVSDFSTPCPEPEGGWRAVDDRRLSLEPVGAHAAGLPGFAGLWVDTSRDPAFADGAQPEDRMDPGKTIINVRFVDGDVEELEDRMREVWGGPLCVTVGATRTEAELRAVQREIMDLLRDRGVLSVSSDVHCNCVTVEVILDDGFQAEVDERYGPGTVVVTSALQPVD